MDWRQLAEELRRRQGRVRIPDPRPFNPWQRPSVPPSERVSAFLAALRAVGGDGDAARDLRSLRAAVDRFLPPTAPLWLDGVPKALWPAFGERPRLDVTDVRTAFDDAAWGVVMADGGAIATGTVMVTRRHGRTLASSLVPPALLALVAAGDLAPDIESLLTRPEWLTSSGALITGPSRSADIENDLTVGVHGPGTVRVIVLEPPLATPTQGPGLSAAEASHDGKGAGHPTG
jgi:hypothetical protein